MFNRQKFRDRLVLYGYSENTFSKAIGMSNKLLAYKCKNPGSWKVSEIQKVAILLEMKPVEIYNWFIAG